MEKLSSEIQDVRTLTLDEDYFVGNYFDFLQ